MNYATIKNCDIANGPGVRVSLFVSGCTHHCPGCFNEEAWDFSYGEPFTQEVIDRILKMLEPSHIKGLTLLGGEPFEPQNQPEIVKLLRQIKKMHPQIMKRFQDDELINEHFLQNGKYVINSEPIAFYWGDRSLKNIEVIDKDLEAAKKYSPRIAHQV